MSENEVDISNSLWVEKYRPKSLDDVVLEPHQKDFLVERLSKENLPHLLFIGPPGSGKCHSGDEYIDIYIDE